MRYHFTITWHERPYVVTTEAELFSFLTWAHRQAA